MKSNDSFRFKLGKDVCNVYVGDDVVGEIFIDHLNQVDIILVREGVSSEVELDVLRFALAHALQFAHDLILPYINGVKIKCPHDRNDSFSLWGSIPLSLNKLNHEEILLYLKDMRIGIHKVSHPDVRSALIEGLAQAKVLGLHCTMFESLEGFYLGNAMDLRLRVKKPYRFEFWMAQTSVRDNDLHITPHYHPVMAGKQYSFLINGDTDYCCSSSVIRTLKAPWASRVRMGRQFNTWTHVKHPYFAVGRTLDLSVSMVHIRTKEGVVEFVNFIRTALGLSDTYVGVSGGFRPPLESPHNRVVRTGGVSPYQQNPENHLGRDLARGSEGHCVWAHRVLLKEGVFEKAHVPRWFYREGWVELYKGAEVRHGQY